MIRVQDALSVYTRAVTETYSDFLPAPSFFTSMTVSKTSTAKEISIEVQREEEYIAVDVLRGAEGNLNDFSISSASLFVPPYYDETFDLTTLQSYDRIFANNATQVCESIIAALVNESQEKTQRLIAKVKRAVELQWAQVFETGIVQLKSGDNIDYKRKAESMVNVGLSDVDFYWGGATANIFGNLRSMGSFLRDTGKAGGNRFVLVLGANAFDVLMQDDEVQKQLDGRRSDIGMINQPQMRETIGGSFHGTLSAGAYVFELFTYPQSFKDPADGLTKPYWPTNKVVAMAQNAKFITSFAGVPAIMRDENMRPQFVTLTESEYHMYSFIDENKKSHKFAVNSAPLAVPVAIDQMVTYQVLASA